MKGDIHASRLGPAVLLLSAAFMLHGCVRVQKVLEPDDNNYPREWGELLPGKAECNSLQGTYANEGLIRGADGNTQSVLLTSILGIHGDAKTVSLSVRTRNVGQSGIAYSTLRVALDSAAQVQELKDCYCIKQALKCMKVSKSGGILGFGGNETNAYFYNSTDRSLIGKLEIDKTLAVPGLSGKTPWVRFNNAGQ